MTKSDLEFAFLNRWIMLTNEPEPTHDYLFVRDVVGHGPGIRKRLKDAGLKDWRFDWAWPDVKVAVEMEGGIWVDGRHVRGGGFEGDCIKYNFATSLGWSIYRITAGMLDRDPIGCINQVEAAVQGAEELPFATLHYICAHCGVFTEVPPDSTPLDSGTTLLCGCGKLTVVDLSTPQMRAEQYRDSGEPQCTDGNLTNPARKPGQAENLNGVTEIARQKI